MQAFLTAIGVDEPKRFEGVNIQLIREVDLQPSRAQLVDFGHYEVRERFECGVVSLVQDRLMRWGGVVKPDSTNFVQPAPELSQPVFTWDQHPEADPETIEYPPRPAVLGRYLAEKFQAGKLGDEEIQTQLDTILETLKRKWPPSGGEAD